MSHWEQLEQWQLQLLYQADFFTGITAEQLQQILPCLGITLSAFQKNTYLFQAGEQITQIGFLFSGKVQIIQEDFWGNRTILEQINTGGMFGEAFACAGTPRIPVTVLACRRRSSLPIFLIKSYCLYGPTPALFIVS